MCLCCFHGDIRMLQDRVVCCQITLESMTALMRDNIHISAGSIEIGKYEGSMEIRHISHIAAHFFIGSGKHLQKMVIQHKIEKFSGLLRKLPVHFLTCQKGVLVTSDGFRTSLREADAFITEIQFVKSQAYPAVLPELLCQRNPSLS